MPPHLHPKSAATSTLFAGTLAASFIVVGIPHIFPCPRPRKGYADTEIVLNKDGKPVRRLKRPSKDLEGQEVLPQVGPQQTNGLRSLQEEAELFRQLEQEAKLLEKNKRECPVPKPTGVIGRLFGFQNSSGAASNAEPS